MSDPNYVRTLHDGKVVDELTHQALLECEKRLGYPLTIVQGSYSTSVDASGGTHDGGGVVDLSAWDRKRKVYTLRHVGFAAWYRPERPGVWGEHIHAVLIGNAKLSPQAASQVDDYRAGLNGLADHAIDPWPRPSPIPTFIWPPVMTRGPWVDRKIAETVERLKTARVGSLLEAALKGSLAALRTAPQRPKR